jgi:outer membrane protein OmpA-like peptidoglycan-associated protein
MKRAMVFLILCGAAAVLVSGCATKKFVREQVGATEGRLGQRVETQETALKTQETALKQTADRTGANAQALETANQRLQGVDSRVTDVSALATEAQRDARATGEAVRETDRRFANRNKLATLETKSVYFDFGKADVRDQAMPELEDVAKALKADPNAVVELQGFADARGSELYNYRLTRDRVDAVTRYLVQQGIELRRIYAVGMGKAPQDNGSKADREALAKSRRVDIVLLAPQS